MVLADSLDDALGRLNVACELGSSVETVYIIGGSSLYADAIGNDTVQTARIKVEESQKSNTDSVAASQGLKVGGGSVA